ncbi:unnamed protein product [Musa acuminata subsp. malaccensis]|uniref:(wild Malaysian banana) hypothetical protein n=1 Tax=Musa acuminata subsp. malaccensis TaxID=214687 RepID=A0A804KP15_MUSAM|nr:unnamed protein product [Musa acuminata subsp. malaccensis]
MLVWKLNEQAHWLDCIWIPLSNSDERILVGRSKSTVMLKPKSPMLHHQLQSR